MLHYLATPASLLGTVVAVVVGLFGHNLSQAWAAKALGDPTPVRAGFGRPNPRRDLDILGTIAALLTNGAWGFAAPVPITSRWRRPRVVTALLAGPLFLLAWTGVLAATFDHVNGGTFTETFLLAAVVCAAGLFVTSMLPIPPLALGRAVWMYAPPTGGWATARYRLEEEQLGRVIAFAILMVPLLIPSLPDIVGELVTPLLRDLRVFAA